MSRRARSDRRGIAAASRAGRNLRRTAAVAEHDRAVLDARGIRRHRRSAGDEQRFDLSPRGQERNRRRRQPREGRSHWSLARAGASRRVDFDIEQSAIGPELRAAGHGRKRPRAEIAQRARRNRRRWTDRRATFRPDRARGCGRSRRRGAKRRRCGRGPADERDDRAGAQQRRTTHRAILRMFVAEPHSAPFAPTGDAQTTSVRGKAESRTGNPLTKQAILLTHCPKMGIKQL